MPEAPRRIRQIIPLGLVFLTGIYALVEASEMTTFGSIFPQFAAGAMVMVSALLMAQVLFFKSPDPHGNPGQSARAWAFAAILAVWALTLPLIGFVMSSLLGSAGALAVAQNTRPTVRGLLLQSTCATVFVFAVAFVFDTLLNVPLP